MELTWEQGQGRESQVQPPIRVWRHYFGINEQGPLPTLRLINTRSPEEELEPPRPVVLHHHNYTIEVRGARGTRPAIVRFIQLNTKRYEYAVYHPDDLEYSTYVRLLEETPNPMRSENERRWFIAPRRRRSQEPWWPPAVTVERAVRATRREAAEENEIEAAREAIAELAGAAAEGQQYASFSARRRVIEERAMAQAMRHFTRLGWTVRDVSGSRSYDLECTRQGRPPLHVEVKGTTSAGTSVLLTANEVMHARTYPHTALYVLHGIRVTGDPPRATGGRSRILNPWRIDEDYLEPLAYGYMLP